MSNIIGITMGDPCGVGPEITVRALAEMSVPDRAATRIYGNLATLQAARDALGVDMDLVPHVVDLPVEGAPLAWGTLSPVAGDAAFRFIEKAVRDAEAGEIGGQDRRGDGEGLHGKPRSRITVARIVA